MCDIGFRQDDAQKAVKVKSFKDGEFSGEDFRHKSKDDINEYEICVDQQGLTYLQKLKLLVNSFKGIQKSFKMTEVNFNSRIAMMRLEYDSQA